MKIVLKKHQKIIITRNALSDFFSYCTYSVVCIVCFFFGEILQ